MGTRLPFPNWTRTERVDMALSDTSTYKVSPVPVPAVPSRNALLVQRKRNTSRRYMFRFSCIALVSLALACFGASWFAYQYLLVPQSGSFTPDWQGARWIQAADGMSSVSYFRYVTSLMAVPDGAFVTIAADQVFRLSVNGFSVGTNYQDFEQGNFPRTYMYDVNSLLKVGVNAFAVMVSNFDERTPALRMSVGFVEGTSTYYAGTGTERAQWKATVHSEAVFPHYSAVPSTWNRWTTATFDSSSWLIAQNVATSPVSAMVRVNPQLYERPVAMNWMSVGSEHEAYFVRRFPLPADFTGAWLRILTIGNANIFINGHATFSWESQLALRTQNAASYLIDTTTPVQYRAGLVLGIYTISPYLHAGENTIAVHVIAPSGSNAQIGLDSLNAAATLDILIDDAQDQQVWLTSAAQWHAWDK